MTDLAGGIDCSLWGRSVRGPRSYIHYSPLASLHHCGQNTVSHLQNSEYRMITVSSRSQLVRWSSDQGAV